MNNNQQIQIKNKITIQQTQDIIINGTFYFPAWKHYNQETIVNCDLCHKSGLVCSIGYQTFDLCLECVNLTIHLSINNGKEKKDVKDVEVQTNDNSNVEISQHDKNRIIEIKSNETITIVANKINIISSDVNYHNKNTFQNPSQTQNLTNSTNSFQSNNIWNKKQKPEKITNSFQPTNTSQPTNIPQFNFSLPTNNSQPTNVFKF